MLFCLFVSSVYVFSEKTKLNYAQLSMYMKSTKEDLDHMELTEFEILQLKEHNRRRVKKVVGYVAVLLTFLSLLLVAFSLAMGRKIDLMVEESMRKTAEEEYLRTGINITEGR